MANPQGEYLCDLNPGASEPLDTQAGEIIMLPSPRDPEQPDNPIQYTSSSESSDLSGVNTEQMFRLIDSILPFEACLFHQFLPLSLEGKYLKLGIVDPNDSTALDYVRRILAFMNCSLKVEQISASTHQTMLSSYLNQTHPGSTPRRKAAQRQPTLPRSEQATYIVDDALIADEPDQIKNFTHSQPDVAKNHYPPTSTSQVRQPEALNPDHPSTTAPPTPGEISSDANNEIIQPQTSKVQNFPSSASQPTLIIDDIRQLQDELMSSANVTSEPETSASVTGDQTRMPSPKDSRTKASDDSGRTPVTETAMISVSPRALPTKALLPLEVEPIHLSSSMEFLATLAPHEILPELLGRLLRGGMGRLYFQRQSERGRIVLRQENTSPLVMEGLNESAFEDIMLDLKRLVNLPLDPVTQPKQIESERLYKQECILLCLKVVPSTHGEEATLQILRGSPLKFYQQQKLERLGQDAIKLAGQLQRKLNEIRDRSYRYSISPIDTVQTLKELLGHLNQQLETLHQNPLNQPSDH